MTTQDISYSFVKFFESEVHSAYQQMGSKLRATVRLINDVKGATAVFQKVGRGEASTKARNAQVPLMNIDHQAVECDLSDYYAGEWIDRLDELKTNHDERRVVAGAGAYALGRKTDELIISALSSATQEVGNYSQYLDKAVILQAFTSLNNANVPDDGQRFAIVGPAQWNMLLTMPEFSEANYVGEQYPLLKGTENRKWLGIVWIMHNGLPLSADGKQRDCFVYHKTAVGHACGHDISTDITWHGDRAAYFVNTMMSQGAVLVDGDGVVKVKVKEGYDLPNG